MRQLNQYMGSSNPFSSPALNACSGLLKLDTQLSGNLSLERSVHFEEKTRV